MTSWVWTNPGPEVSARTKVALPPIEQKNTNTNVDRKGKVPHCCLCSKKMSSERIVTEERPTAEDGGMQKWFYCPACWIELRRLREASGNEQRLLSRL